MNDYNNFINDFNRINNANFELESLEYKHGHIITSRRSGIAQRFWQIIPSVLKKIYANYKAVAVAKTIIKFAQKNIQKLNENQIYLLENKLTELSNNKVNKYNQRKIQNFIQKLWILKQTSVPESEFGLFIPETINRIDRSEQIKTAKPVVIESNQLSEGFVSEEFVKKIQKGFTLDSDEVLKLTEEGRRTINDEDLKKLYLCFEEQQLKNFHIFDISNSRLITGKGLKHLGDTFPNIQRIHLHHSKGLIELDNIKSYIRNYYTTTRYENFSHQTIFKELEEKVFQMGTQPIYFRELKYQFAREFLLKLTSEQRLQIRNDYKTDPNNVYDHKHHCYKLVIEDIKQNKLEQPSHNGATRSTLTIEDLQITASHKPFSFSENEINERVGNFQKLFADSIKKGVAELKELNSPYIAFDKTLQMEFMDFDAISKDLQSSVPMVQAEAAQTVALLKAIWLNFCEHEGRFFALGDIDKICDRILAPHQKEIAAEMIKLSNTFTSEIDYAVLKLMCQENKKYSSHPTVGVIGGGPIGLFSAFKLFSSGANVKVSEERDAAYTRHQIVRLDPLWVNQLKFYLGTEFEKYFGSKDQNYHGEDKPRVGNRSGDGFVECVVNHLEVRLRDRLVALKSLAENEKQGANIELLAAHKVSPKIVEREGKFYIQRSFQKKIAKLKETEVVVGKDETGKNITRKFIAGGVESESPSIETSDEFPVDVVFDVAGKHSKIREGNALARDITDKAPHTVASFFVRGECRSYRDENHDFRRQYLITEEFLESTSNSMQESIDAFARKQQLSEDQSQEISRWVSNHLKQMKSNIKVFEHYQVRDGQLVIWGEPSLVYETRTFVNTDSDFIPDPNAQPRRDGGVAKLRIVDGEGGFKDEDRPDNIVYIGMETPKPIHQFYQSLREHLTRMQMSENLIKEFTNEANLAFIMSVAHEQELDRPVNNKVGSKPWVAKEYVDRRFLATFEVSQNAVIEGVLLRQGKSGGQLLYASGGDSAASPHFMRYSGLSGGREHVGVVSNLIAGVSSKDKVIMPDQNAISQADKEYDSINAFVLSRGSVFLRRLSQEEEYTNIFKEMKNLLDEEHFVENMGSQEEAANLMLSCWLKFYKIESDNPEVDKQLLDDLQKKVYGEILRPLREGVYRIGSHS